MPITSKEETTQGIFQLSNIFKHQQREQGFCANNLKRGDDSGHISTIKHFQASTARTRFLCQSPQKRRRLRACFNYQTFSSINSANQVSVPITSKEETTQGIFQLSNIFKHQQREPGFCANNLKRGDDSGHISTIKHFQASTARTRFLCQ